MPHSESRGTVLEVNLPVISQHTQERLEGYFRHEWNLAIERAHHSASFTLDQHADTVPEQLEEGGRKACERAFCSEW